MDKATISKQIALLINAIKTQFEGLETQQQISGEELHTFVAKANELNKKVAVLEYLNTIPIATKPMEVEKPIPIPVKEIPVEVVTKPVPEAPKPMEVITPQPIVVKENPIAIPAVTKAIIDIKKHIGFNDKFEFINELFKGNANDYEASIHQINSSESVAEALKTFEELKKKFNWQDDNETAVRFWEILKRI